MRACHSASGDRLRSIDRTFSISGLPADDTVNATASATAKAAVSACQLWCVNREQALTNSRRLVGSSAKQAPRIALRMAGPAPPDLTPARSGENPSHNLRHALAVARPTPAGSPKNHQRNFQASALWNVAESAGCDS